MTEEIRSTWPCPKDGTAMLPMARGDGVRRCPACRAVFIDPEALRRGRGERRPTWSPVVTSVLMSLLATFVVRRLRRRTRRQSPS